MLRLLPPLCVDLEEINLLVEVLSNVSHFLRTSELSRHQLDELIDAALKIKRGDLMATPLVGKSVALVFFNPSLTHPGIDAGRNIRTWR